MLCLFKAKIKGKYEEDDPSQLETPLVKMFQNGLIYS